MEHYKLFINGEFVEPADGRKFTSIDPGTGQPIATVAQAGNSEAEAALEAARRVFDSGEWSGLEPAARADKVYDFADQVVQRTLRLAATESMDSGIVIGLSKFFPMLASGILRNLAYYAATKFPWEEEIPYTGNAFAPGRDYIRREPVGVCVGIIPWNFPLSMAVWKIAHSIIMGNSIVLKPASATPLTALILAEAAQAARIPNGVINVLAGPGAQLGNFLCAHPSVDKIAFTGSTEVGRGIVKTAADTLKKVTMELGGKSANIILDDADMELAVEGAAFGTFFHQGQICESGTRLLVSSKIYDEFVDKLKKRTEQLRVGYQLDRSSHLGPLVSASQLATVEGYVQLGKQEGAELLTGGKRVTVKGKEGGFYYAPTIFIGTTNKMRVAREEIFGPVVCVIKVDSDEEAVAIANDSIYGLGGGVFSGSNARATRVASGVRTGTMWINNFHVFGDFCPFGGYKQSGYGREMGASGVSEYVNVKRMHVAYYANAKTSFSMGILTDNFKYSGLRYKCPTSVISGHGSLPAIHKEIVNLGGRRALILTDTGVRRAGLAQLAQDAAAGFCVGVFDDIPQDSDLKTVDNAVAMARELRADCIISVGGGSVIDTAKAVCVTLKNGGHANDHVAIMRLTEPQTPHISIPTTSGTGSEVTNVAVLKSKNADRKVYIVDPHIVPDVAILDPRFTMTLPPGLTASTAMDAMTHSIEALTSVMSNSVCDGQALHAIRLIRENLPIAFVDGRNEDARLNLQIAATMAGWAFAVAQVGLAHAMAHAVGSLYGVPHGTACGLMLPKVMRFNVDHAAKKLAMVAQALGVDTANMDDRQAALAAADEIEHLMKSVNHPTRLRDVGVPADSLQACAFHAVADTAVLFNARPVASPQEVFEVYELVY